MDVVELTRELVAIDSTNPPGNEAACVDTLAARFESAGMKTQRHSFGEDRTNLIVTIDGRDGQLSPLVLTGHVDTVPLGATPWTADPFAGEIDGRKMFGRGVTDMKAGVAAMACASLDLAASSTPRRGLKLVLTGGEETGCAGALALAENARKELGEASALLVGEPTGNRISTGHKGCMAVRAHASGTTAHSSMPDSGENAIYAVARAIQKVENVRLDSHADLLLGLPTINVGTIVGGLNYNSVPDAATFTVDIRTVGGMDHDIAEEWLAELLGKKIELERFVDMPAVATDAGEGFIRVVEDAVRAVLGSDADTAPFGIPFFSDASVLQPLYHCPTVIIGPGEPSVAHQTDEWCYVDNIKASQNIYRDIITRWCA